MQEPNAITGDAIPGTSAAMQPPQFDSFDDIAPPPEPARGPAAGMEAVHDVPVRVQAIIGRSRMPIGDLLRLKSGAVIELDRRVGEPVDILVNNRLIARGEVVLIDGSLGVTLTEIVRTDR